MFKLNVIVVTIIVLLLPIRSYACSCFGRSLEDAFYDTEIVFEGIALRTVPIKTPSTPFGDVVRTTFKVTNAYKGRFVNERDIEHIEESSSCGIEFQPATKYRVFSHESNGKLSVSACSQTSAVGEGSYLEEYRKKAKDDFLSASTDAEKERAFLEFKWVAEYDAYLEETKTFFSAYAQAVENIANMESTTYLRYRVEKFKQYRDYQHLADVYEKAMSLAPENIYFMQSAATAYMKAEEYAKARQPLEKILRLDSKNTTAIRDLAKVDFVRSGDLSRSALDYTDISIPEFKLTGKSIKNVDLSNSKISLVDVTRARLKNIQLVSTHLHSGKIVNSNLDHGTFDNLDVTAGFVFDETSFRRAKMYDLKARKGSFKKANFTKVIANRANFWKSDFSGAKMNDASFESANLSVADLSRSNLNNTNLSGANLRGTLMIDASLSDADLSGALIDCKTRLPEGIDIRDRQMIPVEPVCAREAQNRDFSDKPWDHDEFSGLDLAGANFRDAHFNQTDFLSSNLVNANFTAVDGSAQFAGADLTGASFRAARSRAKFVKVSADESTAALSPAIIDRVDFTNANLTTTMFIANTMHREDDADISTSIFTVARLECRSDYPRRTIASYEDGSYRRWNEEDNYEPKKIAALEQRELEDYQLAKVWLEKEKALVLELNSRWPKIAFGEECENYLAVNSSVE